MPGEAPTAERIELGRLLFFDPVLSRDGSLSCAHCHRPDRGFADGLVTARGLGGAALARNTPTLYNAALKPRLMWDRHLAARSPMPRMRKLNRPCALVRMSFGKTASM